MSSRDKVVSYVTESLLTESHGWSGDHSAPSVERLAEVVMLVAEVVFPEHLIESRADMASRRIAINIDSIYTLLTDQISKAMRSATQSEVEQITENFIAQIPEIKTLLLSDVDAIYKADPAATSSAEIVLCYPSIVAMTHHRVAHLLHIMGVPIIPRAIAEIAHSKCGIDIHPGATIGSHFAIDHGTGVVIGETTIIGKNVVIYQGVTLGAKGFRFDENGHAINTPRHPIIEDDVRIYSNSSILGRITIGRGAVIGGNMWIDQDVEPDAHIVKGR